jgi:hypothetical protein
MRRSRSITAAVAVALSAHAAMAQGSPAPSAADSLAPVSSVDAVTSMKSLLRNLVVLQERYWYNHGTYAKDIAALGLGAAKQGEPAAQLLVAGRYGWAALAQHPSLGGNSCVVYVGNADQELGGEGPTTSAQKLRASVEGAPACDEVQEQARAVTRKTGADRR